jgi:peptidoglycan hydrolase CwlO-like protein
MLPLSHSIKLLRVHDPEKELQDAKAQIARLEKTIAGKDATITARGNEVNRLKLEIAKLKDMLKR